MFFDSLDVNLIPILEPLEQLLDGALVTHNVGKRVWLVGISPHLVVRQALLLGRILQGILYRSCLLVLFQHPSGEREFLKTSLLSDQIQKRVFVQNLHSQTDSFLVLATSMDVSAVLQFGACEQISGLSTNGAGDLATLLTQEMVEFVSADGLEDSGEHEFVTC